VIWFATDRSTVSKAPPPPSAAKFAVTVQSAVIGPVVYVLAASEPPQPVTVSMWKPASAVTVNAVVAPSLTVALGGVIVPDGVPTTAVTVCVTVSAAKFAVTVQSAVIGPVVYVFAASEPPQPVTVVMWKPGFAVTVNAVVAPSLTVALGGVIVPDGVPTTAVTVCVTTFAAKFAMTVQSAMIAPVVYVPPTSEPAGHVPPTVSMRKPGSAVSVNCVVAPSFTVALGGVIVPDGVPTDEVTVCVTTGAKRPTMTGS